LKDWHTVPELDPRYQPRKRRPHAMKPSLRKWFRDHDRLITIVGAIVIFVTFLIKEWYGDNLKDLKQSIDSGQAIFVLQNENRTVQQRLSWLWITTSNTYTNVLTPIRPDPSKITLQAEESQSQFTLDSINRMKDQFDATERLLKNVPHEQSKDDQLKALQQRYNTASSNFHEFKMSGSSTPQAELEQGFRAILVIEREVLFIEDDLDKFSTDFFKDSHKVQEEKERDFDRAQYASIVLYAMGWSLALLGKLFGPKHEEEEAPEV
jgi:hypothetical protein